MANHSQYSYFRSLWVLCHRKLSNSSDRLPNYTPLHRRWTIRKLHMRGCAFAQVTNHEIRVYRAGSCWRRIQPYK